MTSSTLESLLKRQAVLDERIKRLKSKMEAQKKRMNFEGKF